jgi:hypothetical protein
MASLQASAGARKGGARVTAITPPGIIRFGYGLVTMRAAQRLEVELGNSDTASSRTDGRWATN